jgi:hypothetical protein
MTDFQKGASFLIALVVPIAWFWFADISFQTALLTTVGCAGGWYAARALVLNSPEMLQNVFATGQLQLCSLGFINGVLSLIFRDFLQ